MMLPILLLLSTTVLAVRIPEGCRPQSLFPRPFYEDTFNPSRTRTVPALSPLICRSGKAGSKIVVTRNSLTHQIISSSKPFQPNAFFDGWGDIPRFLQIEFAQKGDGSLDKKGCVARVNGTVYPWKTAPRQFEQWMRRMQALVQQFVEGRCPVAGRTKIPELMMVRGSLDVLESLFDAYSCINILT